MTPLLFAILGLVAPPTAAPLDSHANAPYAWRVIVKFESSPWFTPGFRAQIGRDIATALKPAVEGVAKLEVVDLATIAPEARAPLVKAFAEKGWPALESEEFRKLTDAKTHFLRIAVTSAGGFRLEARQHDGSTGLPSPALRWKETSTPDTVGRIAGMLVGRDFGPTATVEPSEINAETVRVTFRGGALAGFDRLVKAGDVFAVAAIRELPRQATKTPTGVVKPDLSPIVRVGQPRLYTLLQVDGPIIDGACKCRVLTGLETAFPVARGIVGYRAIKLSTVDGPVQLRVLDQDGTPPAAGQLLVARASDSGFTLRADVRDALELRDGVFRSGRTLKNVACVIVGLGAGREWRFPVPVLGDGPVVVRVVLKAEDAVRAAYERECQDLRGRVAEARTANAALIDALTALILKGRNQDALDRAKAGSASLTSADAELTAELEKLKKNPAANDPIPSALLGASGDQLVAVRAAKGAVETRIGELTEALKKQADPARYEKEFRAKELVASIRTKVELGDVAEAFDLYDQLFELTQQDDVKAQKKKLEDEWEPRGEAHKSARQFVAQTWRTTAGLAGFRDAVEPLKAALAEMTSLADRLGLRNFLSSLEPAYVKLKVILDDLDPTDRAQVKEVQRLSQELKVIEDGVREELKKIEGKK